MTMRRRLGATLLGAGLMLTVATAQEVPIPAPPAGLPPPPAALGFTSPPAPGGTTIWSLLGINKQQREYRQAAMARTPLGELRGKIQGPISKLTGGIVPEFPPKIPTELELKDPGVIGKGAKLKLDRAGAIDRIKAVKELGTADCHYWPEAEDGLIEALRVDRNEWVRLAAAEALASGCCCTKKTIAALTNAASCSSADDHPAEKSPRVIAAACAALQACLARVCTNPAVMAAPDYIPESPPVVEDKKDDTNKGEGESREASADTSPATSKGPGTEKASPSNKRIGGKEYYDRVARLSWNQVIVPAKMTLAQGPRIPAELALTAGYDRLMPLTETAPNAREQSVRPVNLLDVVLGNQPTQPQPVSMQKLPPAPKIPYAVMQVQPTVPQRMPSRPASQVAMNTKPTPIPPPSMPPSIAVPAAKTEVKPVQTASANLPAPALPATKMIPRPIATTPPLPPEPQEARSVQVCELLNNNSNPKLAESELAKLTEADCKSDAALVPCLLKYALEGSDLSVRLACIQALGRCKANTPAVKAGLEKLISDRSVELRVEAALTANDLKDVK